MDQKLRDTIRECCRNDDSYQTLKRLFEEVSSKADKSAGWLELLERAVRHDYDSILITDLQLEEPGPVILYVNEGFSRMTGYSREEVLGKTPRILQGPKTDRAVLEKLKSQLIEGKSFYGHTVNYKKDGTEFVNQWDIHPLTNDQGDITHWISFQHDITERKRSEERLVDIQVEFDDLMEELKSTIVDVDSAGTIAKASKAFRELAGYEKEELAGMKIWELVPDENRESLKKLFNPLKTDLIKGGLEEEFLIQCSEGFVTEVAAHMRLFTHEGDKLARLKFRNRSMEKRITRILDNRNRSFKKVFGKRTDFTYKAIRESENLYSFSTLSDSFSDLTGRDKERSCEGSIFDLVHKEDLKKVTSHLNRVMEGHSNTEVYRILTKDDGYITVIDYARPVMNDKGQVKGIRGCTSLEISSEQTPAGQ
ncbi:MAG: PAS domain S-box protein [Balneolaceae bacterium]